MERDLKALRRSRLMNYSEFRTMTTSLERYYKDVKLSTMLGRKDTRDLDMRPYLYDEGDSYNKPFYSTLLKMLYEVSTSIYYDKQYQDLKKIYSWYKANKVLISSPPDVPIPEQQTTQKEAIKPESKSETQVNDNESIVEDDTQEKFKKVPKLHLRPKTAPPIEKKGGVRYVTWNEAQLGSKRPASGKPKMKYYSREQYARAEIAKSLKISQIGYHKTDQDRLVIQLPVHSSRPSTAPPTNNKSRLADNRSMESFVLKPYTTTPAPVPSPVSSPLSSPRDSSTRDSSPRGSSPRGSPVPSRPKSPRISPHFSRDRPKDPSVKLSVNLPKENREETLTNKDDTSDKENSIGSVEDPVSSSKPSPRLPPDATPSELKQILQNQIHEEKLLEEQHGLLQKKLLHEYDKYARECAMAEKERKIHVEMDEGQLGLTRNVPKRSMTSPVAMYDLLSNVPSYNRIHSKPKDNEHARSKSTEPGPQSGFSPARHLRQSTVPSYRPDEVNVNMVLDMVTPIGLQMEREREQNNCTISAPGTKQPSTTVPNPVKTPNIQSEPQLLWETSSTHSQSSSCSQDSSRSTAQTPLELKSRQPELSPERNDRDYKVHFQQEKTSDLEKAFKTSGPVSPDTIRYQWTDDGFGSMTYLKKLKSSVSPRTPRKRQAQTPRSDVSMTSGSRSVDKRTLASLMLVRQLGETDRRDSDRMGVNKSKSHTPAPSPDPVEYKYNMEYMTICQPVGPRLGESDKPSTMAWYLQGDHGLYRDPSMRNESDEIRIKREVRIPQDRSLIVQGRHISGGDSEHQNDDKQKSPNKDDKMTTLRTQKTQAKDSNGKSVVQKDQIKEVKNTPRPKSPLPSRPPTVSPSNDNRHISIPTGFGTASRPCSARSDRSEKKYNFSVKQFNHFCWPDEALLPEDVIRQREVWAAVNIQRIFRGFMARQYCRTLKDAEKERQRKAALTLQSHLRGFLTRKRMDIKMKDYTPTTRTRQWAKEYKDELKLRESARAQKKNIALLSIYHPAREGPTKAEMKSAAIVIQRYFRGWFVRKMYQKAKGKALKRTLSFNKFIKGYQSLIYRIQKRYGVENPTTELQFNELMEYVDRLNKYEIAFQKFAVDGLLEYNDIKEYFKSVGHVPSQKEIDDAIEIVTKSSPKGKRLTKAEAVEILFQIYVPKGTGMKLSDVRKSTWLNPLNDGQDIMHLLSKKQLEETNLAKCLALVANAGQENEEIRELLRPGSAMKENKKTSKKGAKERRVTLAQYPLRPSSSRSRSKSPKPRR